MKCYTFHFNFREKYTYVRETSGKSEGIFTCQSCGKPDEIIDDNISVDCRAPSTMISDMIYTYELHFRSACACGHLYVHC